MLRRSAPGGGQLTFSRVRALVLALVAAGLAGCASGAHLAHERRTSYRPGGPEWQGQVTLVTGKLYPLDSRADTPLAPCFGCVSVGRHGNVATLLTAGNGVLAWRLSGVPSYSDCFNARMGRNEDYVRLSTPKDPTGVAVGHWVCTASRFGSIVRMQYLGQQGNVDTFRFAATAWAFH